MKKITSTLYVVLMLLSVYLAGCSKEGTISLNNLNDQIGAEIADSNTVRLATYQLGPLPTNGQSVLLVGGSSDTITGNLSSTSYFRISNSSISSIGSTLPSDAILDSISLALPYQGYYYGDTTQIQEISLHQVNQTIELIEPSSAAEEDESPLFTSGSALYNNTSFTYEEAALGTVRFRPKPHSKTDTVFIKLQSAFGEDLWNKIKTSDRQITNTDEFLDYIKGLVLVPEKNASTIVAFATDSIELNLYYSSVRTTDGKRVQTTVQMGVDNGTYQYNHIQTDRSQSLLKNLPSDVSGEVLANDAYQQAVIQGLGGLVTKVQFPYLYEFVNRNDVIINRAELIVETPTASFIPYAPPTSLNIMVADAHGVPQSILTSSYESTTQTAYLFQDITGGVSAGKYTFNLTEYVSNLRGSFEDKKSSLYLTIPTTDLLSKTDRLLIGNNDGSAPVKLRILYTKYR